MRERTGDARDADDGVSDKDLSLHPLDPEDALRGFLQVDPEKVKERERCTCKRWPIRGGKPDPKLPGVIRDVEVDRDAIDPACPVHGAEADDDDGEADG